MDWELDQEWWQRAEKLVYQSKSKKEKGGMVGLQEMSGQCVPGDRWLYKNGEIGTPTI